MNESSQAPEHEEQSITGEVAQIVELMLFG
jgi:hypothetical protein